MFVPVVQYIPVAGGCASPDCLNQYNFWKICQIYLYHYLELARQLSQSYSESLNS